MRASNQLIEKIKEFEGLHLNAYKCPAGVPTIGAGHTRGVKMGQTITMAQADALLRGDILPCEKYVNSLNLDLTQGQFDALVDFCFNLGTPALAGSTLLKKIRSNSQTKEIQGEFRRWNKSNGKVLQGLVTRREWEALMYAEKTIDMADIEQIL